MSPRARTALLLLLALATGVGIGNVQHNPDHSPAYHDVTVAPCTFDTLPAYTRTDVCVTPDGAVVPRLTAPDTH